MATRPQTTKPTFTRRALRTVAEQTAIPLTKKTSRKVMASPTTRSAQAWPFIASYQMDFADKIRVIRSGLPAQRVCELSSVMGMPIKALIDSLGLSHTAIKRKVQREHALSPGESERVMGIQALIGQVQAMIAPESTAEFDAAIWLANWLVNPLPALAGATPASFMDTVEGQKYVSNLLEMSQSGSYA